MAKPNLVKENTIKVVFHAVSGYSMKRNSDHIFIISVRNQTSETLLNDIRKHIAPGSIIYSDCWRTYNDINKKRLYSLYYYHHKNFVDLNCHNVERLWRDMRANISRYGTSVEHYTIYLAERLFKRFVHHIGKFFIMMSEMYPITDIVLENTE